MAQAVAKAKEQYGLDVPSAAVLLDQDTRPPDASSGELSAPLLTLPAGARVEDAPASVSGRAFHGTLAHLAGARVTAGSVVYGTGGATSAPTTSTKAFIVDFGRPVSVLDLRVSSGHITFVLPWLGTDFAATAAYPANSKSPGTETVHARLTGLETQKLLVQLSGAGSVTEATFPSKCTITTGTVPANLRASVNGRPPFWTHPGPLSGDASITGLATELNALAGDGDVPVTLLITTDAPGVLELDFDAPQVDRAATARWGGAATTDVVLAALIPVEVVVPFVGGEDGPWTVTGLTVEMRGAFPPWRAYPAQATSGLGRLGLRVDATFSAAGWLDGAASIYGVALPLRVDGAAEVHVALVADADGVPGSGKPLAASVLTLAATGGAADWIEALFGSPVAADGAWLVVQAKTGAVEWVAAAEPPQPATLTLGASGSARWSAFPAVPGGVAVAQARVLRAPFPTENEPLLEIGGVALDPPGTVELPGGESADHSLTLTVLAQSSGTLTLGPASATYR